MRIKEATLLSLNEYTKYQHLISNIKAKWWLRTPVDENTTYFVDYDGGINTSDFASTKSFFIRPALRISEHNYGPGNMFDLFNLRWIVLDYDLAICAFARKEHGYFFNVDWENSNLKQWLDNWLNDVLCRTTLLVNIKNETEYIFLDSFCSKYLLPNLDFDFKTLECIYGFGNVCFNYEMHKDWETYSLLGKEGYIVVSFADFCNVILYKREKTKEKLKKIIT